MLDGLLAEARLRWGLDPAGGLALIPAERLVGIPLEPTQATLIVPLSDLRVQASGEAALAASGPARPWRG